MSKKFVTEDMLSQAVEAILNGIDRMFKAQDEKFDKRFSKLENGQVQLQRQISNLKMDTPTQKEFDQLKEKVDLHYKN